MPVVIIFLGPSLPLEDALAILKADYRPPVRREDLPEILENKPEIIGIIDGVFFQDSAVGHKEILQILKAGIKVVGASSMGALRASELDSFGMIGIGEIYKMYRDGIIEADDEVALICDPITNLPCSEALVNVRITCDHAHRKDLISDIEYEQIISAGKKLWYPDRTWNRILQNSIQSESRREYLSGLFNSFKIDQKKTDAIEALKFILNMQQNV